MAADPIDALLSGGGGKTPTPKAPTGKTGGADPMDTLLGGRGGSALVPANKQPKKEGILGQALHAVTGFPEALGKVGVETVKEAVTSPYKLSVEVGGHGTSIGKAFPLVAGVVGGFKETGTHIVHPTSFVRDLKENPIGTILNDAANLSVVGSLAAKPLEIAGEAAVRESLSGAAKAAVEESTQNLIKAGLTEEAASKGALRAWIHANPEEAYTASGALRAAKGIKSIASLGGQIAGAPAKPFVWAAKIAKIAFDPITSRIMDTAAGKAIAESIAEKARTLGLDKESRDLNRLLANREVTLQALSRDIDEHYADLAKLLPHHEEQSALTLILTQLGKPLAILKDATDEELAAVLKRAFPDEQVSLEAARIAGAYERGELLPEQAKRFDQAIQGYHEKIVKPALEDYLAGKGAREPLSKEGLEERARQTGRGPLQFPLRKVKERYSALRAQATKKIESTGRALAKKVERAKEVPTVEQARASHLERIGEGLRSTRERQAEIKAEQTRLRGERDAITGNSKAEVARKQDFDNQINELQGEYRSLVKHKKEVLTASREQKAAEEQVARAKARTVRRAQGKVAAAVKGKEALAGKEAEALTREGTKLHAQPARLRPALIFGEQAKATLGKLAEELPDHAERYARLAEDIDAATKRLGEAGWDPVKLHGGYVDVRPPGTFGGAVKERAVPSARKGAEQRFAKTGSMPRTLAGQAEKAKIALRTHINNDTIREVVARFGTKAGAILGEDAAGMSGRRLALEMRDRGYEAWNPKSIIKGKVQDAAVDADTVFVQSHLMRTFTKHLREPGALEHFMRMTVDPATRAIKIAVLHLNPKYHIGVGVGSMLQLAAGEGMSPASIIRTMRAMRAAGVDLPRELRSHISPSDAEALYGKEAGKGVPILSGYVKKSKDLNKWMHDTTKHLAYLHQLEKGATHEEAIAQALRIGGDYGKLSPLERKVASRIFPFYAWTKHITTFALKLPIEHPMRAMWIIHLGDMLPDDALAENRTQVGSDVLNLSFLGSHTGGGTLAPEKLLSKASPLVKVAAGVGFGLNLGPEGPAPLTRPFGTGRLSEVTGKPAPTPLYAKPGEIPSYLLQQLPQSRALRDFIAGSPARYQTGAVVKKHGRLVKTGRSRLSEIARFFQIPAPEPNAAPAIAKARGKALRRAARAKARYEGE